MADGLRRSLVLMLVLAGSAQAATLPVGLDEVAAIGPRTLALSAQGSAALWLVSDGRVRGCVRPPYQEQCANRSQREYVGESPIAVAGRDVYVADGRHNRLVHWRRAGGRLRYASSLRGVDLAEHMVLADGGRLLAVSTGLGRIAIFRRSEAGHLTRAGTLGKGVLPQQSGLWVAASGRWLVAAGSSSITTVDARTLTRADCVTDAGTFFSELDTLPECRRDRHATGDVDFGQPLFAVGRDLYSADYTTGGIGMALGWWRISPAGRLSFGGCLSEGARSSCSDGSPAIADPTSFAASGGVLAVGGTLPKGIAVLRRNRTTGALRFRGVCVTPTGGTACAADPRIAGVRDVEVTRTHVHVTSGNRLLTYAFAP